MERVKYQILLQHLDGDAEVAQIVLLQPWSRERSIRQL
jgi:hypothetical protein